MTGQALVVQQVTARMVEAFSAGRFVDAQNMNHFLASLERMTPEEYLKIDTEEISGAIS